jgi:hypothetical protein
LLEEGSLVVIKFRNGTALEMASALFVVGLKTNITS